MNVRDSRLDRWRGEGARAKGARVCDPQKGSHFQRVGLNSSALCLSRCGGSQSRAPVFCAAFTLIELLTVIAIIGLLAVLAAPIWKQFAKPNVTVAAGRQMLDDCARARQLAISRRSTVYMVFIPTNFWNDALKTGFQNEWSPVLSYAPSIATSTIVTQMYGAQWCGYYMASSRNVGDQPGRGRPQDLVRVRTLPQGSFIAPFKFTAPQYYVSTNVPYPTNRPDLPIYGFLTTSNIPFPTCDLLTNSTFVTQMQNNPNFNHYVTVPYIAFNYLGQLTPGDGSLLPYDENIPIEYGTIAPTIDPNSRAPVKGFPTVTEMVPGNSTNISYNVIHIDRLTGRARLERQEVQ